MRTPRKYLLAATVGVVLSLCVVAGAQAGGSTTESPRYSPEMVKALAASLGVSEKAAIERLDRQAEQQTAFAELRKNGVKTDGAFFTSAGTLIVNAANSTAATAIKNAGLSARIPERGQSALDRIKDGLDAKAVTKVPTGVVAWSADLASDTVTVQVNNDKSAAARSFLKAAKRHGDAVRIVKDQKRLETQTEVPPGKRMTFNGYLCSVGYGAKGQNGTQYLVTAGHCIEDLPELAYQGERFAKGENTRFALGQDSVDMGIAKVDPEDSIGTTVDTYGNGPAHAVKGSQRAAVGADICKAGQTTGWTCGQIKAYNVTVTYSDPNGGPTTVVTGLGSSSVCTQGGDSGGAYISGDQAQGMTSGGPTGQQCNGGVNSPGSSYFQPLDDALAHYQLTLNSN
ncbi:S1 family peptidase [Streptomyces sp. KR80]|uniref:S1 family peptidase n=1 Tax=Streptomyces sp. KR80 TaxID=3457426 RepID=UPI003FD307C2